MTRGKKIYFASDFHLGYPNASVSRERELRIIRWLDSIYSTAEHIFLVGDLFDFWYEYNYVVPKGFIRFQGKLASIVDAGVPITIFTGNHDVWLFDYFTKELGIPILKEPTEFEFNNKRFLIGHGDGLGPGDYQYKFLKKIFTNRICQFLFEKLHPSIGIGFGNAWSHHRKSKAKKEVFLGEKEWLWTYCKEVEAVKHYDYYIFGHRHLPLDLPVGSASRYLNLGEWMNYSTYVEFDGEDCFLLNFES